MFGYERGAPLPGPSESASPGASRWHTVAPCSSAKIGDMPLESQTSLLRFLETGRIERLGGTGVHRYRCPHRLYRPRMYRPGSHASGGPALPQRPIPSPVCAASQAAAALRRRRLARDITSCLRVAHP
ncbi:sigma 54-interacting transcriptional regulator [Cupriavidus basilensis]